jgi:hypothetical protein
MATSPALSLRAIAAQVGRSHTLVQRLITTHQLTDCDPGVQLAAAHLALRRRIPAPQVARWVKSQTHLPTGGFLVYTGDDADLWHTDNLQMVAALIGNPDLGEITVIRVDSLTYRSKPTAQGVAA